MNKFNIFDPLETSLTGLSGLNLVEASAGTGKTYAISSLFIRLLLELKLSINEILVITYTNTATDELKERIRTRLKDVTEGFLTGDTEDVFIKGLTEKITDKEHAVAILTEALNSFDMASIFTIHGFCFRVLKHYAFESRSLFDTEMEEGDDELLWEIVKDFWRKMVFNESRFFLNYALKTLDVKTLYSIAKKIIVNPGASIIKGESFSNQDKFEEEWKNKESECIDVFHRASSFWKDTKDSLYTLFENAKKRKSKKQEDGIKEIVDEIDQYFNMGYPLPLPKQFQDLYKLIENQSDKTDLTQAHPFFELCNLLKKETEELKCLYDTRVVLFKKTLLDYVKNALNKRKQLINTRSFNDLLLDVHRAISSSDSENLLEEISRRYKVILIDEFQDTDPLQYEIIRHIYNVGKTVVFIIGDPKQSIYSFRGADIFSYIRAAKDARTRWTLEFNYRSSERLIKAVNAIFQNIRNPFVFSGLDFKPVRPAGLVNQGDLMIRGRADTSPLKIWLLKCKDNSAIKVDEAIEAISKAIAEEVVRLLHMGEKGEILVDDRPLSAKDIAVIVRKNKEATQIQKALNMVGIPGVIYTTDSVFTTDEAIDVLKIISAISEPNDESKVKGALITDIMGKNGDELIEITEDEKKWNEYMEKFEFYRNLWLVTGFITMARTLISSEKVKKRLISMENGERKLTNVLHIIELIHKACVSHRLNIEGALKWLTDRIQREKSSTSEEYQLRLETDEEAVKILTIHRSKGLEFPIVFCPFNWSKIKDNDRIIMFHDEKNDYSFTIDINPNPDESSKNYMEIEELAENIRLLYVSLTRAKKRCYLVWGKINQSEDSSLAYILYSLSEQRENFSLEGLKDFIKGISDNAIKSILNRLVEKSEGTIEVLPLPEYEGIKYEPQVVEDCLLLPRIFKGTIDKTWSVVSFSSLVSKRPQITEMPDRDENIRIDFTAPSVKPLQKRDIFNFPQGTKAGLFMHDVLEHTDFSLNDREGLLRLIDEKLIQYGFEREWQDVIYEKVKELVNKTLKSNLNTFTLSGIDNKNRLNELEFYMPLNVIETSGLGAIFDRYGIFSGAVNLNELIRELGFKSVHGMLRGFIDLVFEHKGRFYIVDWKSNFLGERVEDYNSENIKRVMLEEYYFLQYHLYTLAVHNLLSFRKKDYSYERHFGGVFYIFIRGIESDNDECGVFFDLPEKGLIEELNKYIGKKQ